MRSAATGTDTKLSLGRKNMSGFEVRSVSATYGCNASIAGLLAFPSSSRVRSVSADIVSSTTVFSGAVGGGVRIFDQRGDRAIHSPAALGEAITDVFTGIGAVFSF